MKNRESKSSIREIVSEEYRKVQSVSLELGEKYTQEQFKTMYEKYFGSEEKTELMKFFEQTVETSAISHGEITEPYQKWIDKMNDDVHTKEFSDDLKQQTDQVKEKQYRITTLDDNFIDARFLAIQADEFSQKMVEELSDAIRDSALVEYNGEMIKVPELLCKLECLGFDTEYKEKLISKSMGETQTALFTQFHGELIKVLTAVYKNGPSENPTIQKAYKFADYLQRGGTKEGPGFSNPKLGFALLGVDYNKDSLTKQTFVTYRLEDASNQIRYIPYKDRIAIRSTIERDEKFNALFTSYNLITRKGNPKDYLLNYISGFDKLHGPRSTYMKQFFSVSGINLFSDWFSTEIDINLGTLSGFDKSLLQQFEKIQGAFKDPTSSDYDILQKYIEVINSFYHKLRGVIKGLKVGRMGTIVSNRRSSEVLQFLSNTLYFRSIERLASEFLGFNKIHFYVSKYSKFLSY